MSRALLKFLVLVATIQLGACASPTASREPEPLRVPYAAMTQSNTSSPLAMFPLADADFPRGERVAVGPTELSAVSVFNEMTYDVQRIGPRDEGGYRYQYSWRQVLTLP